MLSAKSVMLCVFSVMVCTAHAAFVGQAGVRSSMKLGSQAMPLCRRDARPLKPLVHRTVVSLSGSPAKDASITPPAQDDGVAKIGKFVSKVGTATWLAWWLQAVLSVVSTVTLFFANSVKGAGSNILANGVFFAGIGVAVSFVNVFWTWGYARIANKIVSEDDKVKQSNRLKGSLKLGVIIALSGMLITLIGAEQIVGSMVAKAISGTLLYGGAAASPANAQMQLQALDIFVVQANTNTLLSHLTSVINSLYIASIAPVIEASKE